MKTKQSGKNSKASRGQLSLRTKNKTNLLHVLRGKKTVFFHHLFPPPIYFVDGREIAARNKPVDVNVQSTLIFRQTANECIIRCWRDTSHWRHDCLNLQGYLKISRCRHFSLPFGIASLSETFASAEAKSDTCLNFASSRIRFRVFIQQPLTTADVSVPVIAGKKRSRKQIC